MNSATSTSTFGVDATEHHIRAELYMRDLGNLGRVESLRVAQEIVAQFPKSYRLTGTHCSAIDGVFPIVILSVQLKATDVTGDTNEAGLKRFAAFVKKARALGYEVEHRPRFQNSLPIEHPLLAPLAQ